MPDKNPVVVKIEKDPKNPGNCLITPDPFKAEQERVVTFHVVGPSTHIKFLSGPPSPLGQNNISPFDKDEFEVEKKLDMLVRNNASEGKYKYSVIWRESGGDVTGNGTGEVVSR